MTATALRLFLRRPRKRYLSLLLGKDEEIGNRFVDQTVTYMINDTVLIAGEGCEREDERDRDIHYRALREVVAYTRMCVCMCVCVYVCMCMCMHGVYVYMCICVCIYMYVYVYVNIYVYIYMYVCAYVLCLNVCIYVCATASNTCI